MKKEDIRILDEELSKGEYVTYNVIAGRLITDPNDTVKVKEGLEKEGFKVDSFESGLVPQNYVVLDEQKLKTFQTMLDKMDDLDDVQEVFHNVDMPEVEFED